MSAELREMFRRCYGLSAREAAATVIGLREALRKEDEDVTDI